ncbi:hypothetical protein ACWGXJ_25475 [Paenibacillus sp. S33]
MPSEIEKSFFPLDFYEHKSIAYRIFSSAQRTVIRFALLNGRIGPHHIYDLQGSQNSVPSSV